MNKKHLCLFDMDGTLTPVREKISQPMIESLRALEKVSDIGIVTGSGMNYVREQCEELLSSGIDLTVYPCNGTQAFVKEGDEWVLKNAVKMKEEIYQEKVVVGVELLVFVNKNDYEYLL